jgi:hypothetical protein
MDINARAQKPQTRKHTTQHDNQPNGKGKQSNKENHMTKTNTYKSSDQRHEKKQRQAPEKQMMVR